MPALESEILNLGNSTGVKSNVVYAARCCQRGRESTWTNSSACCNCSTHGLCEQDEQSDENTAIPAGVSGGAVLGRSTTSVPIYGSKGRRAHFARTAPWIVTQKDMDQ
jgi:hypothetical protein